MPEMVECLCGPEPLRFSFRSDGWGDFYCRGTIEEPGPVRIHAGHLIRTEGGRPKAYCAEHFAKVWKVHKEGCQAVTAFASLEPGASK